MNCVIACTSRQFTKSSRGFRHNSNTFHSHEDSEATTSTRVPSRRYDCQPQPRINEIARLLHRPDRAGTAPENRARQKGPIEWRNPHLELKIGCPVKALCP